MNHIIQTTIESFDGTILYEGESQVRPAKRDESALIFANAILETAPEGMITHVRIDKE